MKHIFSVFFLVLVVEYSIAINKKMVRLPPEASSALIQAVQQCIPKTGVPPEALLKVYQGSYSNDKNFKAFIFCSYKTAGYIKPDGSINIEKMSQLFKQDPDVLDGLQKCGQETGKDPTETVYNFFKCWQDTVPVAFTL